MYRIIITLFSLLCLCISPLETKETSLRKGFYRKPVKGSRGHRGKTGREGIRGTTGPTGISYNPSLEAYFSAYEEKQVSVAYLGFIPFSHVFASKNFSSDGNGVIETTAGPGQYEITCCVMWQVEDGRLGPRELQVLVNDIPIESALMYARQDPPIDYTSISTIVTVTTQTATFKVRNDCDIPNLVSGGYYDIVLGNTSSPGSVGASIKIKKIAGL